MSHDDETAHANIAGAFADMTRNHIAELEAEKARLQAQMEEAEREIGLVLAGLDCQNANGYIVPGQMKCEGGTQCAKHQRDGYKARAEQRGKDIEALRDMAHDWYETGLSISQEWLDEFCAIGPTALAATPKRR